MDSNDLTIINQIKQKKKKIKKETNQTIFKLCKKTIILYAKNNKYECIYIIPYFVFGLPKYNIENVSEYIIKKLKKSGFNNILFIEPNYIYINWYSLIN